MKISAEWFLLDNLMMNFLVLRLCGAVRGVRTALWRLLAASLFGAGYAMLAVSKAPVLNALLPKLGLSLLMAAAVTEAPRAFGKALLCLLLSACLMGGVMLALTLLFGGAFRNGAYICTVPVRVLLVAGALGACLPRCLTALTAALRTRAGRVRIRLTLDDRVLLLHALVDTGNLLTDPLTGLPVIVVQAGLLPAGEGRPLPYRCVGGGGVLTAVRPKRVELYLDGWRRADAVAAASPTRIDAADAIVGATLIAREGRWADADAETVAHESVPVDMPKDGQADPVHAYGGDAAGAVFTGGGTDVDRTAD